MAAHRRDLRAGAHRRGHGGHRQAGRGADRARAGDARRVRPLLPGQRAGGRTRWTRLRPARSATPRTPRTSWRWRASARACRSGCSAARRRRATGTWRRSTRPRCATAACWISAAARCSWWRSPTRQAGDSGSWRVGAVRMTERFLPAPSPPKRRQLEELRAHVASELQSSRLAAAGRHRLVGIGGTVRNLAAAAQRAAGLPSNGVQGVMISQRRLSNWWTRLAELPAPQRSRVPGIKPARADLILAGAIVVQEALRAGGFEELEVTEAGLREGVFFERHLAERQPPLFEDVRRASVLNLAAPLPHGHRPHAPRREARAGHVRPARRAGASRAATPTSASCCGRRASCTTSACRSTTTTTTSTRAT